MHIHDKNRYMSTNIRPEPVNTMSRRPTGATKDNPEHTIPTTRGGEHYTYDMLRGRDYFSVPGRRLITNYIYFSIWRRVGSGLRIAKREQGI